MVGEGSVSDAGKGAAVGAGVGSVFGPLGTGIGAGLGALGGWLFGGDDDSSGGGAWTPEGHGWMSPTKGQEGKSDIWGPPEMYMQYGQGMQAPTSQPIRAARGMGGQAAFQQQKGLGMLRRRAEGKDSIARQAGQREREKTQRQIVSTARSGRRSPAAARTALMQTSQAGQMISGKIAEAEAKEKLAAEKAYFAASSGMRGDALKQQQTEQKWWGMKADWERVKKEVLAKYMALGLSEKESERRARIDYQKLLAQIYNKHLQHKDEMGQRENEAWMGLISSGIQAVGQYAGAKGSDVRGKTNLKTLSGPSYANMPIGASLYMSQPVGSNYFVSSDEECKMGLSLAGTSPTTGMAGGVSPMGSASPSLYPEEQLDYSPPVGPYGGDVLDTRTAPKSSGVGGASMPQSPWGDQQMSQVTFPELEDSSQEAEQMLDQLTAYEFDYKPGYGPPGRQVGVMAQDLEKSPMGAQMVSDTGPAGSKMVDYSPESFNPVAMASLANLNDRVRGLEGEAVGGAPYAMPQSDPGATKDAMVGGGAEYNRQMPVAPQQGIVGGMADEEIPDVNAYRAMLAQMGGRV